MPKDDKHKENTYQINAVRKTIIGKESRGESASFERELLEAWGENKG